MATKTTLNILAVLSFVYLYSADIEVDDLEKSKDNYIFRHSDGRTIFVYGCSVAMSASHIAVGRFNEKYDSRGSVSIFRTKTLQLIKTLQPPDEVKEADGFGRSIAMNEEMVIVGSPFTDNDKGCVYVYKYLTNGKPVKLFPEPGDEIGELFRLDGPLFGWAVAINDDNDIAVGAYRSIKDALNAGKVYAYRFIKKTGTWARRQKIQPSDLHSGNKFGISVSISLKYLVVGAPDQNGDTSKSKGIGAVYVYEKRATSWQFKKKLRPPAASQHMKRKHHAHDGHYGYSVSLSAHLLLVGAYNIASGKGNAFVYRLDKLTSSIPDTNPLELAGNGVKIGDRFGLSVSLQGNSVAVGGSKCGDSIESGTGCVSVFKWNAKKRKLVDVRWNGSNKRFPNDKRMGEEMDVAVATYNGNFVLARYQYTRSDQPIVPTTPMITTTISSTTKTISTTSELITTTLVKKPAAFVIQQKAPNMWEPFLPFRYRHMRGGGESTVTPAATHHSREGGRPEVVPLEVGVMVAMLVFLLLMSCVYGVK